MSKASVLVTMNYFPESAMNLLCERFDVERCDCFEPTHEIIKRVQGKFGIICAPPVKINESVIEAAGPSLKVVVTVSVGYDHVELAALEKHGVRLGRAPDDISTEAVAETAVGLLISTTRRFFEANRAVKMGEWLPVWKNSRSIKSSTVGIIGCGHIGTSIAKKMISFEISRLLYTSRSEKPAVKSLGGKLVTVDELVEQSDFVILAAILNKDTKHVINKERLAKMKSHAVLINIGRGELIDQDELIKALQENRIGGVGLDVTTPEPLPVDNPLMKMENVVLLPHIGSATTEVRLEMFEIAVKNIIAVRDNRPMPKEVQF